MTPDDKYVVAGLRGDPEPGEPTIQVIDAATDKVVWGIELTGHRQYGRDNHEVRPMAFEANPDGSTKRMFAQATAINGVWVIDWNTRKVVDDALAAEAARCGSRTPTGFRPATCTASKCFPIASAVWASSRLDSRIYGWSLPDLKYIGAVEVGPTRQLDDVDARQPLHVRGRIGERPHVGGGSAEAGRSWPRSRPARGRPGSARRSCPSTASIPPRRPAAARSKRPWLEQHAHVAPARMGDWRADSRVRRPRLRPGDVDACRPNRVRRRPRLRRRPQVSQPPPISRPTGTPSRRLFMTDRGGTIGGMAACVMCHTWQTKPMRFSLETPATDAGWTVEQSRRNFDIVTKLVNTANPETSRLLLKPLARRRAVSDIRAARTGRRANDPEYQALLKWIRSLPADRYVPAPEPALDFTFFRSCVQQVFATPREGHIACSNCHAGGLVGFAPAAPEWQVVERRGGQAGVPDRSRG